MPEAPGPERLGALSTFRLPAAAHELVVLEHPEQIPALPDPTSGSDLILGGGSNTVFLADWPGRVLLNRIRGLRFESAGGDAVRVFAAAGESWHGLVRRCLDEGLHGIENLALIPGSVGAAPIQNIGAYGIELDRVFEGLTAWDRERCRWLRFGRDDCGFRYRDSRFKSGEPDRYLITEVVLRLSRSFDPDLSYASLRGALDRGGIARPDARQLVATILRLRRHRLPDPARLANAGSFFKNPIVDPAVARDLLDDEPELPHWTLSGGAVKLAAGWMIDRLGFRGERINDAGVYANHALVLVNHGNAHAEDLLRLIDRIVGAVEERFGIRLEPEPRLVGGSPALVEPQPRAARR
ncbi:UDP-N-acetylmuramate dehydrogenase [Halomonas denitrificans]|nr:UDP-N-acetylmuramate dehydrogenase [Halomonas denitrificans]